MGYSRVHVNTVQEIKDQVKRFKAAPKYWKDACGKNPVYFVCLRTGKEYKFGLSKFCAMRNITLQQYVEGQKRNNARGGYATKERIKYVTGKEWKPIEDIPAKIRSKFRNWFGGFYANGYKKNIKVMILD